MGRTVNKLPRVKDVIDYKHTERVYELSAALFTKFIKSNLEYHIRNNDCLLDVISDGVNIGYSFAFSTANESFHIDKEGGYFSYRDNTVKSILRKFVDEYDLDETINWARGMGVFVFNIWEKKENYSMLA